MSIRIRNGRYVIDYYPDGRKGRRVRLTLPPAITDRQIVEEIERDLRSGYENSELRADSASRVSEIFPSYLSHCELHMADSTYRNVAWTWEKQLEPRLGSTWISEIDTGHLTMYKRLRKSDGVSNRTVNKEMSYFMGFLKWCRSELKLNIKDVRYLRLKQEKKTQVPLSIDEAIRLILHADPPYKIFMLCLYSLGLRFSEAASLLWRDLDEANRTIRVMGKGSKERVLPVSDWLLYALGTLPRTGQDSLIFRSRITGGRIRDIRCAMRRAAAKAGIVKHVNPHLLRHTLATHMMGMNINIKIIQKWLGHTRESTTADMYTHAELDHLRNAQAAIDVQMDSRLTKKDFATIDYQDKKGKR